MTLKGEAVLNATNGNMYDCAEYSMFFHGHVDEKQPHLHEIQLSEGTVKMLMLVRRESWTDPLSFGPVSFKELKLRFSFLG